MVVEEYNRILEIRKDVLIALSEEYQGLASIIEEGNFLITTLSVENRKDEVFIIMDFTSKQHDHIDDLTQYSIKLFENFAKQSDCC